MAKNTLIETSKVSASNLQKNDLIIGDNGQPKLRVLSDPQTAWNETSFKVEGLGNVRFDTYRMFTIEREVEVATPEYKVGTAIVADHERHLYLKVEEGKEVSAWRIITLKGTGDLALGRPTTWKDESLHRAIEHGQFQMKVVAGGLKVAA